MIQSPFLAIALRTNNTTLTQMKSLIQDERKIIRIWGFRNTLHYYCVEDWNLICSYLKKNPSWFEKRIRNSKINYDQLYKTVEEIVLKANYVNREILLNSGINKNYLGPWGDIFIDLNNNGLICSSCKKRQAQYANRKFWCPNMPFKWIPYDVAFKNIVLRYFECYGPATINDFMHWLGIPITKKNNQIILYEFKRIGKLKIYCENLWGLSEQYDHFNSINPKKILKEHIFFLGKFDPLLLSYNDKSWIVDAKTKSSVWRKAGHISAVILMNGRVCAIWDYRVTRYKLIVYIFKLCECKIEFDRIKMSIFRIANLFGTTSIECIIKSSKGNEEEKWICLTENINGRN